MKLTDTHCHIIDDSEKYTQSPEELVKEWNENNGGMLFIVGTHAEDSVQNSEIAKKFSNVYSIVGIHPQYALSSTSQDLQTIENLAKDAVAIGEIGLDFYYTKNDEKEQLEIFEKQMEIANKYNKPVCIHCRDAIQKTIDILKKYPNVHGVMHCYGGSKESARELVSMGYMIGVGGIITFKNNVKLVESVKEVGIENIVLETDSPYLTPKPYRGKTNKPMYVKYVAEKVAELLNMEVEEVLNITQDNACKIYKL